MRKWSPRGQNTQHPGARPGVLKDPAPQEAVTVGYVAAPGPLLSTPMLADTAAETVDARTVKYLLKAELKKKQKEEEQERMELAMEEEDEEWHVQLARAAQAAQRLMAASLASSSSRPTRRKKKRKKKILPKSSS